MNPRVYTVDFRLTLIREYLREFSKKFETAPMEYLGGGGAPRDNDSWKKNLKSKISCQTPFKRFTNTDSVF
jgi:hypothetical protein